MSILPYSLVAVLSLLWALSASAEESQPKFYWTSCIAFGEFWNGDFAEGFAVTTREQRAVREQNVWFNRVIEDLGREFTLDDDDISRFHNQIDLEGQRFEDHYQSLKERLDYKSRQDMFVSDLCTY